MITAVLFDLYETLITEGDTAPPRASKLGPTLGLDEHAFRKEWKLQRPRIVRGDLTFADALMEIGARLKQSIDPAALQRVRDERMRAKEEAFRRVRPDLVALTSELSNQGVRLAVLSNCWAEDAAAWPTCALAPHFAVTAFSFELRAAKPDPEIYEEASRRLGVDPKNALYIGDGADDELAGAERAGMRAARAAWFIDIRLDDAASASIPRLREPREVMQLVADWQA